MVKVNLLIFTLLSTLSYSQTTFARFPGPRSTLLSPNRRYALRNVNNRQEPYHSLMLLTDKRTRKTLKIYEYGRHAAVVWAPDSTRFAIKEIEDKAADLAHGHHEYFGVARWLDNQRVLVHHWGHGDGGMFCQCYVCTLNGRVQKCARQPKSSDPEQRCADTTP